MAEVRKTVKNALAFLHCTYPVRDYRTLLSAALAQNNNKSAAYHKDIISSEHILKYTLSMIYKSHLIRATLETLDFLEIF